MNIPHVLLYKTILYITFDANHISKYITVAEGNGLKLMELKKWFDEDNKSEIPRLTGFVFQN